MLSLRRDRGLGFVGLPWMGIVWAARIVCESCVGLTFLTRASIVFIESIRVFCMCLQSFCVEKFLESFGVCALNLYRSSKDWTGSVKYFIHKTFFYSVWDVLYYRSYFYGWNSIVRGWMFGKNRSHKQLSTIQPFDWYRHRSGRIPFGHVISRIVLCKAINKMNR